jgi:hypothetical protein
MQQTSRTEWIRKVIRDTFTELGSATDDPPREALLIRDGTYCGHRFKRGSLEAVWFVEENQVKFYGTDGRVVKVVSPDGPPRGPRQKAA